MSALYISWLLYAGGAVYFLAREGPAAALLWVAVVPLAVWAYVRFFPRLSPHLGYGAVTDEAPETTAHQPVKVTLYTSLGCPFCPIVERRLGTLQEEMGFELERVDVTTRPGVLLAKGIRAVPVVEVGGRRLVGNATTRELANLVTGIGLD